MNNYKVTKIIRKWKKESGVDDPVAYKKRGDTLTVFTNKPGWMIGRHGVIINKYEGMLRKELINSRLQIKIIETDHNVV